MQRLFFIALVLFITMFKAVGHDANTTPHNQLCPDGFLRGRLIANLMHPPSVECIELALIEQVDEYQTATIHACHPAFVDGIFLKRIPFDHKLCLRETTLPNKYRTHEKGKCARNFRSNGMAIFSLNYEEQVCIRVNNR